MTVHVYLGKRFWYEHERRAFGHFLDRMLYHYEGAGDVYAVVVEPEANMAAMDLVIITPRALIVADLKELDRAKDADSSQIVLHGSESGSWEYALPDGRTISMGRPGKENPYQQLKRMSYQFGSWLADHSCDLPGGPWSKHQARENTVLWVVVSPGFEGQTSSLDLPWDIVGDWFKVLPLEDFAHEVGLTTHRQLALSSEQIIGLAEQLGTRCENLQQFVPRYEPPPPTMHFFSQPRVSRNLVGRDDERSLLLQYLKDRATSILCLGGPGGIGKTELTAWLADRASEQGLSVWWMDCRDREVTSESFLAAVAARMPNARQASALVSDPEIGLDDKIDLVLGFFDSGPSLLIFDDYHYVGEEEDLERFFARLVQRTRNVKAVLTTRERPTCLDDPTWPPGTATEVTLPGLTLEATQRFIQAKGPPSGLEATQIEAMWERTSGNPYALALLVAIIRSSGWDYGIAELPLYEEGREQWFYSLLDTLTEEARSLAYRLSVVRTGLTRSLIGRISFFSSEETLALLRELIEKYVLREQSPGEFQMYEYIREFLYSRASAKVRRQAHSAAASYFIALAQSTDERLVRAEHLLRAIDHLQQCDRDQDLLEWADCAFGLLRSFGIAHRSHSVAEAATEAARALGAQEHVAYWLLRGTQTALDLGRLEVAENRLEEAFSGMPAPEPGVSSEGVARWRALAAQLWVQRGRLAYKRTDLEEEDQEVLRERAGAGARVRGLDRASRLPFQGRED